MSTSAPPLHSVLHNNTHLSWSGLHETVVPGGIGGISICDFCAGLNRSSVKKVS